MPSSGEMPLTDILDEYLSDNHDWENCTDIVLPDVNNGWKKSNKITNFREFNWPASIILDNETLIRMYLNECKSNNKAVLFLFESTKGCPYHCTFCDWGSATYSKVRIKPLLMCEQEIKWMAEHDVDHIYVTDANFGLVKEHIKVAEYFAKYKLQTNYPSKFKVFTPKNSKNTFNKIIPILNNAGLFDMYIAEVQDLNEEVLNNVKRQEISWEEHLDVFKEAQKVVPNLSINLDTIIGMPGQTINTLLKDVDKILSYNIDYPKYNTWHLLPNSPASNPNYLEQHKIKSRLCYVAAYPASLADEYIDMDIKGHAKVAVNRTDSITQIVTETYSFTEEDFVHMRSIVSIVQACQTIGILKYITYGLKYIKGVNFDTFYKELYFDFLSNYSTGSIKKIMLNNQRGCESIYTDDITSVELTQPEFPQGFPFILPSDIYWTISILWWHEDFYKQFETWLAEKHPDWYDEQIADLIKYNKNMLPTPDYNPVQGRSWVNIYDWQKWIESNFNGVTYTNVIPGPGEKFLVRYNTYQSTTAYSNTNNTRLDMLWYTIDDPKEKLIDYFYKICFGCKANKFFEDVEKIK